MASLLISACHPTCVSRGGRAMKIVASDHSVAAVIPTEISVSMEATPWRALRSATRWNSQAAHVTIGSANPVRSHCQPAKPGRGQDGEHHRQVRQRDEQHRRHRQPDQQ